MTPEERIAKAPRAWAVKANEECTISGWSVFGSKRAADNHVKDSPLLCVVPIALVELKPEEA